MWELYNLILKLCNNYLPWLVFGKKNTCYDVNNTL